MDIELFKQLLLREPPKFMVQRYLFDEFPYAFKDNQQNYYDLREKICGTFDIHPNNFTIVGSAKLGFSLNPDTLWRPFTDGSDIDIVLVSDKLFQDVWMQLLLYGQNTLILSTEEKRRFKELQKILYFGKIRPDKMPPKFPFSKKWWSFFNNLSRQQLRTIRAALFKSWQHVSFYYEYNFASVKERLQNESNGN